MEPEDEELVYCKELWTIMSGTHLQASEGVVFNELQRARKMLIQGTMFYRRHHPATDNKLRRSVSHNTCQFILALRRFMGLDAIQSWQVMAHYLMYEYPGTESELKAAYGNTEKFVELITAIWQFYRRERLFLLKCINLIVTYSETGGHPHQESFSTFLSTVRKRDMFELMMIQLERTCDATYPSKSDHGQFITYEHQLRWEFCNLREQLEILHNLIMFMYPDVMSPSTLHQLLSIATSSKFGRQHERKAVDCERHGALVRMIGFLHNVLLMQCLKLTSLPESASFWTKSEIFYILDAMVERFGDQIEHAPVLLSWTLIKVLGGLGSTEPSLGLFAKLGHLALNGGAFHYLKLVLRHHMFKETSSALSTKTFQVVYDLVFMFACKFKKDLLCEIEGLLSIVGPLLHHPNIVEKFWLSFENQTGLYVLYEIVSSRFPADFIPFMEIADSLAENCAPDHLDKLDKLKKMLFERKSFTEVLNPLEIVEELVPDEPWRVIKSTHIRQPSFESDFYIPDGTPGCYVNLESYFFKWDIDYKIDYTIIPEFNNFVHELYKSDPQLGNDFVKKVTVSLSLIKHLLIAARKIWNEMVPLYERVVYITHKLRAFPRTPSKILSVCIDIVLLLLPFFPNELEKNFREMRVFPDFGSLLPPVITSNFQGVHYSSQAIGQFLLNQESVSGQFPLLISYLSHLHRLIKPDFEIGETLGDHATKYFDVIMPGVMFVISEVFPYYSTWRYDNERDAYLIAYLCLKVFHELLYTNGLKHQKTPEEPKQVLRRLVLHGLLNMRAGEELLRISASGEAVMQSIMEKEFNWISGQGMMGIYLVHHCLSVLNRVLLLKRVIMDREEQSHLEQELFCSPDKKDSLKVLPTVASYIDNIFSPELTTMAVRLLTRLALDRHKLLLPCLGLGGDLLLDLVFKRLNSKLVTNSHKVALLQFVAASVDNQPGMCDSLFNLRQSEVAKFMRNKKNVIFDVHGGVLVFACAVLDKAVREPEVYTTSVYAAVVNLICTIWLSQSTAIIHYLRKKEDFWTSLCSPFLAMPSIYVYPFTQILNIMVMEMFEFGKQLHPEFQHFLQIFLFSEDTTHFKYWSEFVTIMLTNKEATLLDSSVPLESLPTHLVYSEIDGEFGSNLTLERQPQSIQLLLSWKRFIIMSLRRLPVSITTQRKIILRKDLMEALQILMDSPSSTRVLLIVELYLVLTSDWQNQPCDKAQVDIFKNVLSSMAACYPSLSVRMKEALLGLGLMSVKHLASKINEDDASAETLVKAACEFVLAEMAMVKPPDAIITMEMDDFKRKKCPGYDQKLLCLLLPGMGFKPDSPPSLRKPMSGILSLHLLQNLLKLLGANHAWLKSCRVLIRTTTVLVTTCGTFFDIMKSFGMVPYFFSHTVSVLHLLVLLVSNDVASSSLSYLLPEHIWLQVIPEPRQGPTQWLGTPWIEIYALTVNVITLYAKRREYYFLNEAVDFTRLHCDFLRASIVGLHYSIEPNLLKLTISVLDFLCYLALYKTEWLIRDKRTLTYILESVMSCIHVVAILLVSPSTLKGIMDKTRVGYPKKTPLKTPKKRRPVSPTDATLRSILTHNQLLMVASRCLAILQNFRPGIEELIHAFPVINYTGIVIIDMDFTPPVLCHRTPCPRLTFASLLTLLNVCQQSLTKGVKIVHLSNIQKNYLHSNLTASLVLKANRALTRTVLEMTAELIIVQGMLFIFTDNLEDVEVVVFRRKLHTEMTAFLQFVKRTTYCGVSTKHLDKKLIVVKKYMDALTENVPGASYLGCLSNPNVGYLNFTSGHVSSDKERDVLNKPPVSIRNITAKFRSHLSLLGKHSPTKTSVVKQSRSEPTVSKPCLLIPEEDRSSIGSRENVVTLEDFDESTLDSEDVSDIYLFIMAKIFHEVFEMF